ncbi:MAG: DUF2235 domain-containing protein [Rhodobacteraceae bacterium]|nr:DUF2235 domain-containing protein [Paracoccaceae bacterium]
MKRIVIACDGTWNRADMDQPSNVLRLARAVAPHGADGIEQVVCHLDGVGSGRGTGWLARTIDKTLGGAMGFGLMENIAEAYRFLVFNHAPGDQIFLFGYSRGAFTARSLVGLIRNCGLLRRDAIDELPEALALYRSRGDEGHPNGALAREFRARNAVGGEEGWPELSYLGIWDTVGSLGIPKHLWWAARANRGLAFHDTALTSKVRAARHAVAIDERRRTFQPALWDNLAVLNAERPCLPYRQLWFPGTHGSIGGGTPEPLSNEALHWVAEGAIAEGLMLDPEARALWAEARDCRAAIPSEHGLLAQFVALGHRDRNGPADVAEIANAGRQRWSLLPDWRPGALKAVADELDMPPGFWI